MSATSRELLINFLFAEDWWRDESRLVAYSSDKLLVSIVKSCTEKKEEKREREREREGGDGSHA